MNTLIKYGALEVYYDVRRNGYIVVEEHPNGLTVKDRSNLVSETIANTLRDLWQEEIATGLIPSFDIPD